MSDEEIREYLRELIARVKAEKSGNCANCDGEEHSV